MKVQNLKHPFILYAIVMIYEEFFELFSIFSCFFLWGICYRISFGKYFSQNGENSAQKIKSLAQPPPFPLEWVNSHLFVTQPNSPFNLPFF
jgi:hypothetical protein